MISLLDFSAGFFFDSTTGLSIVTVVFLATWLLVGRRRSSRGVNPCGSLPPSPPFPFPVIGHLYLMSMDPQAQFRAWRQQYGNLFSLQLGSRLVVVISSYKLLKEAFVKHGEFFSDRPNLFILSTAENRGIVLSSGETWREQRKVVMDILRELGLGRNTLALKIQEEVQQYLQELHKEHGATFDPVDNCLIRHSVSNVICSVVFGKRYDYGDPTFLKYMKALESNNRDIGGHSAILNFLPFLRFLPGDLFRFKKVQRRFETVKSYFKQVVAEHVKEYGEHCGKDLICAYLREMKKKEASGEATTLNDENLLQVIGDLFGAGTDTVTTTICWAIAYFLHYPQVQEKCFQEIQDKIGNERLPTVQDKLELPYVEATIMEVLRRANVVPLGVHRTVSEDFVFHGHYIPKNAVILPFMESVLLDEQTWGDPKEFRPERFLDDSGKFVKPVELIPFNVGRRSCLGESLAKMELFLFMSAMIQRFHFLPPQDGTLPSLQGIMGITLGAPPFKVRAVPRN